MHELRILMLACLSLAFFACRTADKPSSTPASASGDGLQCDKGELVSETYYEMGEDNPGGPSTPKEALGKLFVVDNAFRGMSPDEWIQSGSSPPDSEGNEWVELMVRDAERTVGVARAEFIGDGWVVLSASFCSSYVEKTSGD